MTCIARVSFRPAVRSPQAELAVAAISKPSPIAGTARWMIRRTCSPLVGACDIRFQTGTAITTVGRKRLIRILRSHVSARVRFHHLTTFTQLFGDRPASILTALRSIDNTWNPPSILHHTQDATAPRRLAARSEILTTLMRGLVLWHSRRFSF